MATKRNKKRAIPKRRKPAAAASHHINSKRIFERAFGAFYEDGNPELALELLQQVENQEHMSNQAMRLYLDVLHHLHQQDQYARVATALAERLPNDPDAILMAAGGAYATMQPISSILWFERFLKIAPENPAIPEAKKVLQKLRKNLPELLEAFDDDLPKDLPRIASTEKILHAFKLGCFDDVTRRATEHLKTHPNDLRIRNNLAEANSMAGDFKSASSIIDVILGIAPENFFALAVRCRLAYFQGNIEQSEADAEKLNTLPPRQISDLCKAAQSFAYVGQEDKIRWAYEEADRRGWLGGSPNETAVLTELFATSLARAGDTQSARRYWKQAVELTHTETISQQNLDDSLEPVGQQFGPAYLELRDWVSPKQQDALHAIHEKIQLSDELDDGSDEPMANVERMVRRFLQKHPELERAIPAMLDRGDAASQQLALLIAPESPRRFVKDALLDYARGTRGTDALRHQLLAKLKDQRHDLESPISIYTKGKLHQILIVRFQITDEPDVPSNRTDETCRLLEEANLAMHDGDAVEAERLLRQVKEIEPNEPDVLNNLAMALELQKRTDETNELIDEMIREHPDYFFGQIAVANRLIQAKQHDDAIDVLLPLQQRKRLHFTEFFALVKSMVYLHAGNHNHNSAAQWLNMLSDYDPDHPDIPSLRGLITREKRNG